MVEHYSKNILLLTFIFFKKKKKLFKKNYIVFMIIFKVDGQGQIPQLL